MIALLFVQNFQSFYPGKNGEEGKEYRADDVGAGKVELDLFRFAPCDAHVNEGDEIKEGPQTGECHVEYDVMFASLDGGHLLKEPLKISSQFLAKVY